MSRRRGDGRAPLLIVATAALAACAPRPASPRQRAPEARPAARPDHVEAAPDAADLGAIDAVVEAAIARKDVPGAVVVVVRDGEIALERAYGLRSVRPVPRAMTVDTLFDLGSLTKVVATTPAVLALAQEGKLALRDRVSKHLAEFARQGKGDVTIEQLLTHTSGLVADNDLRDYADGPARAMECLWAMRLRAEPGTRFVYSDVGFMVLGALVERVSGERLDAFARDRFFRPLGMRDTTFTPDAARAARAAPTVERDGRFLQGEVHDPRAALLGGVAGHAGLFATGRDLARYARMLLNRGALDGTRVLDAALVDEMTRPRPLPEGQGARALGWDVQTKYSGNRGRLPGGFGHTGYPGTSMWVVPKRRTAVIVLSSRLHPDGHGSADRLRREIAEIVARSLDDRP